MWGVLRGCLAWVGGGGVGVSLWGSGRRHGDVWYVGGLAGWDGRTVRVDLSLLPEGTYAVELFRDGENAARIAQDYVREEFLLAPGKSFDVKMFPGGGFAARITRR